MLLSCDIMSHIVAESMRVASSVEIIAIWLLRSPVQDFVSCRVESILGDRLDCITIPKAALFTTYFTQNFAAKSGRKLAPVQMFTVLGRETAGSIHIRSTHKGPERTFEKSTRAVSK